MKTRTCFVYALCALLLSCNMIDAQVIWLTTKNMDFKDCDREERDVKPFDAVSNTCPFDVIVEQSDEQYVIVEGDEEYFDRLHTDVRRGVLEISIDPARYRNVRLRVRVGCPEINAITMSGSGSVICSSDIITIGVFDLRLSGSGEISIKKLKCAELKSSVAGSGDLRISDLEAVGVSVSMAGSGDWGASSIVTDDLSIVLTGSGDVEIADVNVDGTLSASVAGSGDILINGKAKKVSAKVAGSGDISGRLSYDSIVKVKGGSGDIDW